MDQSTSPQFDNLDKAVALMVEKGWTPLAMTINGVDKPFRQMYVILKR